MKKLNKNLHEQKRTVEAMQGGCGPYGCTCGPVECACSDYTTNNYSTYTTQGKYYAAGFKQADR